VTALVVVSPHLDDGVLSCAGLLRANPQSHVLTVLAGGPSQINPITGWDRSCGFNAGDDVLGARRDEDRAAVSELGGDSVQLGYWDSQYRNTTYDYPGPAGDALIAEITDSLVEVLAALSPDVVVSRIGILHEDHRDVALAAFNAASRLPLEWWVYEDLPYRREFAKDLEAA